MSLLVFMLVLTTGSALIAAWIIGRLPQAVPVGARGVTLGLVGAVAAFVGTPHLVMAFGPLLGAAGAAVLVVLPLSTYIFLAIAWLMLYVARAIAPYVR